MREFYLQAILEVSLIDCERLWRELSPFQRPGRRVNYQERDNHYLVYYTGDSQSGFKIVEFLSQMKGDIKIYAEFGGDFVDTHRTSQVPTASNETKMATGKGKQNWLKRLKSIIYSYISGKNNLNQKI